MYVKIPNTTELNKKSLYVDNLASSSMQKQMLTSWIRMLEDMYDQI